MIILYVASMDDECGFAEVELVINSETMMECYAFCHDSQKQQQYHNVLVHNDYVYLQIELMSMIISKLISGKQDYM